mgnify:CR=1 FL=1
MNPPGTVLVTGSRGYLGSCLVPECRARGWRTAGLDCGLYDAEGGPALPEPDVEMRLDVRDVAAGDLRGVGVVLHAAAYSTDPLGEAFPDAAREVNVAGTARLADAARDAGVSRFVLVSTAGAYAPAGDAWSDESSPMEGVTVYRRSKIAAEAEVLARRGPGFEVLVVRLPTLYGDAPSLRLDLAVNGLVRRAVAGGPLELHGDGRQWRPLGHVRDVARLLADAAVAPLDRLDGPVVNACTEAMNHRVAEMVLRVARAFPGIEVVRRPPGPGGGASFRVRSVRLPVLLPAFAPSFTLDDAIVELRRRWESGPPRGEALEACTRAPFLARRIAAGRLDANGRHVVLASPEG